jgi:hypothetical protein
MEPEIKQHLDPDETVIFSVNSKRQITSGTALFGLFFSLLWLGITFIVGYGIIIGPIITALSGGTSTILRNGVSLTLGANNLSELVFPGAIIGLFCFIGLSALGATTYSFFSSGGWFVGTNKRFLHLRKNTFRSINWNEFSGSLTASGDANKGDLVLELKNDSVVYTKGVMRPYSSTKESITIVGVPNVPEIERLCRAKIEEFKVRG